MTDRDRPRLNITLDPDLKERADHLADELDVPLSRLIEEILHEFIDRYEEDPMVGVKVRKSIADRKQTESTPEDEETAKQEIKNILDAFDETEAEN